MRRFRQGLRTALACVLVLCCLASGASAAVYRAVIDGRDLAELPAESVFQPSSNVSDRVEQYTAKIKKYAAKHGIPEYAELIKAVMMQESKGAGKDPMQASESAYNKLYPLRPNSIKDPEYSIDVGTQSLSAVLRKAGVKGPDDYEGIALALQGYNYGMGYITWALENYGGYSKLNAVEYSEMMCKAMKWKGYGDRNYVSHVLYYYCFPQEQDNPGQLILSIAGEQRGKAQWLKAFEKKRFSYKTDASAMFVYWCAERAGCFLFGSMPNVCSAEKARQWFVSHKGWKEKDYSPVPGDILFLDREKDGSAGHVAIVSHVEDGVIHTVEADRITSLCIAKEYDMSTAPILGYGHPAY